MPYGKIQESSLKGESTSVKSWQLQEGAWSSDTYLPPLPSPLEGVAWRGGIWAKKQDVGEEKGRVEEGRRKLALSPGLHTHVWRPSLPSPCLLQKGSPFIVQAHKLCIAHLGHHNQLTGWAP